jgi:hypothetical protein
LQICRRPFGIGVAVGVQFGEQPGMGVAVFVGLGVEVTVVGVRVGVGDPATLFVKMTSVTPLPILTTTVPRAVFLLTVRSGLTSIRETK